MSILAPSTMPAFMQGELPENLKTSSVKSDQAEENVINFEDLLSQSNDEVKKQQAANSQDGLMIGETKDEKTFREQLEKVTGKKQGQVKNKLETDDYLTLLFTQLKYQDPSKPMEQSEMASQMAQLNSVQQLVSMNTILKDIKQQNSFKETESLSKFLGNSVEIKDNANLVWNQENGQSSRSLIRTTEKAADLAISILNTDGRVVRTLVKSNVEPGECPVSFDGKDDTGKPLPSGRYSIQVTANSYEGKPIATQVAAITHVVGIETSGQSPDSVITALGHIDPKHIVSLRMGQENSL